MNYRFSSDKEQDTKPWQQSFGHHNQDTFKYTVNPWKVILCDYTNKSGVDDGLLSVDKSQGRKCPALTTWFACKVSSLALCLRIQKDYKMCLGVLKTRPSSSFGWSWGDHQSAKQNSLCGQRYWPTTLTPEVRRANHKDKVCVLGVCALSQKKRNSAVILVYQQV